jgi:hypothetical protein
MGSEVSDGVQPFFELPPHLLVLWSKRKEIPSKSQLQNTLAANVVFPKSKMGEGARPMFNARDIYSCNEINAR